VYFLFCSETSHQPTLGRESLRGVEQFEVQDRR
jgi:hypothetical protein